MWGIAGLEGTGTGEGIEAMRLGRRYLGTTSSVLSSAPGDEFGIVVLKQVFIEVHVFLFGQDGIVGLETIFGE